MSLILLKKNVRDGVNLFHVNKHQSFQKLDFNSLDTKVFYKVVLSLSIKHSQTLKVTSLKIALQYLKKEVNHKAS